MMVEGRNNFIIRMILWATNSIRVEDDIYIPDY